MSYLKPSKEWSSVYQLEKTDPALAGPNGIMNRQAQSLLNRTEFLDEKKASKEDLAQLSQTLISKEEFNLANNKNAKNEDLLKLKNETNTSLLDLQLSKVGKIYVDTALTNFQNGAIKTYPTLSEANEDISNIALNTKVSVLSEADGGDYYKATSDAQTLTRSPYDIFNKSATSINITSKSLLSLNEKPITLVDFRPSNYQTAWPNNNFNTLIFCSPIKNTSVNFLSIPSWFKSNFDYLRIRVLDLKDSFDYTNAMNINDYIAKKIVLQDFQISAEKVTLGSPRILTTSINNGINVEIRIPFMTLSSFADKTLNLGFVVEAFFNDGTQANIHALPASNDFVPTNTVSAVACFYTEDQNTTLQRIAPTFCFTLGFENSNYKQNIQNLLSANTHVINGKTEPKNQYSFGNYGYYGLGITFKSLQASDFNCVTLNLNGLARLDHLRYTIFTHNDTGDINNGFIGYASGTPVYSDKLIVEANNDNDFFDVDFVFDRSIIPTNTVVSIFVQGIINNQVVPIGFSTMSVPASYNNTGSEMGWYAGVDSSGALRFNSFNDNQATTRIVKKLEGFTQKLELKSANTQDNLFNLPCFLQSSRIDKFEVNVRNVKFNTLYINGENRLNITSNLTFDATATQTVTKTVTLLKSEDGSWSNTNTFLARDMYNVSVKQGSTTLVKDTDYKEFNWYGKINAIKDSLNNVSVDVTYSYENYRVDVVAVDTYWRRVEVIKGTERSYDPYEYVPALSENYKPLALVLVKGNSLEFMPLGDCFEIAGKPNNPSGDYLSISEHNRKALLTTFSKISRGENIRLIGYGDSITADEYVNTKGEWERPNGKERDRADYLEHYYPADSKALTNIKKFIRDDYDGTFQHAEIGWNWSLKNYIEQTYGVIVQYDNWAIGGGNVTDGKNRMQYVLPTVSKGDIAVVCYGTNGGLNFDDLSAIVKSFQSKGVSVILMPTPLANPSNNHAMSNEGNWSSLNGYMLQEAMRLNCAIVPTWHYLLQHSSLSWGISSKFRSNQNLINHPGLFEFQCYGKMLCNIFG
ncbi:hypothetical protein [Acinetobacter ursingii]|uniref:hypothetical protein n=1 Tax=Acinetobacter ursingii TaxID=108980 RepID=UPI003AF5294D